MAKRRGTGEGSVYRREDGVWVASVTMGCTDSEGGPIRKSNLLRRSYKPLLERAGLPLATRFHDLRHSAATLLLAKGCTQRSCRSASAIRPSR
jgi:integrase